MSEFFLWFWLLDRRFLCEFRPALKYFSFLFLIPIAFHSLSISFNLYCLFPFKKLMDPANLIVAFQTILEMILTICLMILIANLYNLSKKQPKRQNNIFVLIFERLKNSKEENFVYYEDYWIGRTILFSAIGIIVLLGSIINIAWSIFYVLNKNMFLELFDWVEQFVIFVAYLNILLSLPVILILVLSLFIKLIFIIIAIIFPSCVFSLAEICCKRNKGLNRTIDFSDIQTLEPEYV